MATLKICFCNQANIITNSVVVTGCKMRASEKRKVYDREYADTHDIYYVRKDNEYGIRWVVMEKDGWRGADVAVDHPKKKMPPHHTIAVYKFFK